MDRLSARLDALEGRLIAHRRMLTRLMELSPDTARDAMQEWLSEREIMPDGQEDPGALADEGAALELALADEMRLVLAVLEANTA